MRKASLLFGSSRWRVLGKHSNKVLHWKASQEARSSAWESIHGGMVSRPETEEIRVYSSVPREACPNRVCIATLSRAASPSAQACCPKRPIRRRRRHNSASPSRPQPSAMLDGMDDAERRICVVRPYHRFHLVETMRWSDRRPNLPIMSGWQLKDSPHLKH